MYLRTPTVSVDNTVTRTVAAKVISDLKSNLGISEKAFTMLENIFDQKTFKSGVNVKLDKNVLENPIAEYMEATISAHKLNGLTTIKPINEAIPLFKNKYMSISTEFVNYELVLSMTYKTKSKVGAKTLENELRDHHITRGAGYMHNVEYYYILPEMITDLMMDIFDTSKIKIDDGSKFIDFIKSGNIKNSIVATSTINGYDGALGLAAIATTKIHGLYETDLTSIKSEHDKDRGEWSLTVDYKVNYLSPESFITDFEILANNELVPEKYLVEKTVGPDSRRVKDELYNSLYTTREFNYEYVAIPPYDNHKPIRKNNGITSPIFSVLVAIEIDNKKDLFNLNELVYYELSDDVLNYIRNNLEGVVSESRKWYDSAFVLDLYKDGVLQPRNILNVDEELNVSSKVDLSLLSVYRVVLSVVLTESVMTKEAYNLLTDDMKLTISDILKSKGMDPRLSDNSADVYIVPGGNYIRRTAQISTVRTFIKKSEE